MSPCTPTLLAARNATSLQARIAELENTTHELTMTIGGRQRMGGGDRLNVVQPHDHRHVLGTTAQASSADVAEAMRAAQHAAPGWQELPFDERAAVLLRAADLLAGPWRDTLNAATILGQSKSVQQAEIDAACELIDFLRFNVHFGRRILRRTARCRALACGTGWTIGRSTGSSWRSRRSTSPRSRATCRSRPR